MRAFIYYALSVVSAAIALIIFFKSLDWKAILFLILGLGAVLLFRQGIVESRKEDVKSKDGDIESKKKED